MRGKAWPVSGLPVATSPGLPETGRSRPAPDGIFGHAIVPGPIKRRRRRDGAGLCAGHAPAPLGRLKTPGRMEVPSAKLPRAAGLLLLLLLLLGSLAASRQSPPECCRQKTCSCRVYDLLHGMGNHAAGILTLGKRKSIPPAFQSRLYRLLHGSGNHAAGILTMGKRGEPPGISCHGASGCPADPPPTSELRGPAASPTECQGHSGKDVTKSQAQGAAKSFY
ncbi:PREDICTED: orexin [Calidris pugnax]|uniref:orexin n=1 Tax=Calidris pugnax TaxID=198806 RepID=UPI00071DF9AE|nr:PREDICTED: orexin [Calidris pugnax]